VPPILTVPDARRGSPRRPHALRRLCRAAHQPDHVHPLLSYVPVLAPVLPVDVRAGPRARVRLHRGPAGAFPSPPRFSLPTNRQTVLGLAPHHPRQHDLVPPLRRLPDLPLRQRRPPPRPLSPTRHRARQVAGPRPHPPPRRPGGRRLRDLRPLRQPDH